MAVLSHAETWILMKQDYRGVAGLCFRSITNTPAPFVPPNVWTPENARQFWLSRESSLSYASLPPRKFSMRLSRIENIFARRMVLASGFRGSSLRLPLSGMVYCEIATRTLKEVRVLLISKRGRREEKSRGWKRQSLVSRPQNHEPSHAVKILRQLLTFVKGIGPLKCPIERSSTLEFP